MNHMTCILVLESFKPLLNTNILEFNFDVTIVSDEKSCVTKLITVPPEINMELFFRICYLVDIQVTDIFLLV